MKWLFFFLGGALVVALAILLGVRVVKRRLRRVSREFFGGVPIKTVLNNTQTNMEEAPKSVSGMDSIYLPQILEDFPDFNDTLAKTYVKERLEKELSGKTGLRIHKVVISDYRRATEEKTIIYQASLEYCENGRTRQRRYVLHYSYLVTQDGAVASATCPNCGGPVSATTQRNCEYCGSLLVNVLGNSWKFTEVYEK